MQQVVLSFFQKTKVIVSLFVALSFLFAFLYFSSTSEAVKIVVIVCFSLSSWLALICILNAVKHSFPKPIRSAIRWLHAMSFEAIVVFCLNLIARPIIRLFNISFEGGKDNRKIPILLVHGYLCDRASWIYLRYRLLKAGFGPVYTIDLGHVLGSINEHAKEVAEMANRIKQETNRSELILIGHSMGGLVSCLYASQFAPKKKIIAVFTIGSPLGGTVMASMDIGKSGKEMALNSEFVQKIQKGMQAHPEIAFYQIMSQTDELIIPPISAYADARSDRHYAVGDIGHMTLLFSSRVANRILEWLKIEENCRQ